MLIVTDGAVDIPDDLTGSNLVAQVPGEIRGADGSIWSDRRVEFSAHLRASADGYYSGSQKFAERRQISR